MGAVAKVEFVVCKALGLEPRVLACDCEGDIALVFVGPENLCEMLAKQLNETVKSYESDEV